jgi:hypothetical protein
MSGASWCVSDIDLHHHPDLVCPVVPVPDCHYIISGKASDSMAGSTIAGYQPEGFGISFVFCSLD